MAVSRRSTSIDREFRLGTVPTLVVPLQKTLAPEIESRYKAIQDTKVLQRVHKYRIHT